MPAALDVDREAVKTLAVAIGVREAARQMGLPEATVQAWSAREGWTADIARAKAIAAERRGVQPNATKASEVMANILSEDGKETRLSLSRTYRKAAAHAETLDGSVILEKADKVRQLAAGSSTVHGWEEGKGNQGFTLQILSMGGQTGIKITQGQE